MIIAIDGPAGTGKSTVARGVASRLGFAFFDTGAMYRSVAWMALQEGIDPADSPKVIEMMPKFDFVIRTENGDRKYLVNGKDVTSAIRTREISNAASQVAVYPEVRQYLVKIQRKFGRSADAVFEGRDMGTVVFPDADLKIFLTASAEVRAGRRYRELLGKFPDLAQSLSFDQILKETIQRDRSDETRVTSPLKQAQDAILIDTSEMTVEEVIDKIVALQSHRKRLYPPMKWSYSIVYHLARFFFKVLFRLEIRGLHHFRPGAGLVCANHTSYYDPPVLSISCPEEVHFLAKESLFSVPLLGPLIRTLNTHPVSRGAGDIQILKQITQLLIEGKKVIVFPEGARSLDGEIQPFERGVSFLAQRSKCPVFPAYIQGAFDAWPRGKKWPKLFGKMICVFGAPIYWDEFEGLPKREAETAHAARCEQAIRDLKKSLRPR